MVAIARNPVARNPVAKILGSALGSALVGKHFRYPGSSCMKEELIRDPSRVENLGEVFTPSWLVREILDLVPDAKVESLDTKCLDPACGHGQFLVEALVRKLAVVASRIDDPEECRYSLLTALTNIYGVDIDRENVFDARKRLSDLMLEAHRFLLGEHAVEEYRRAVLFVLERNIIQADFLHDDFEVAEFGRNGSTGYFLITTRPFSAVSNRDPRGGNLFSEPVFEGPLHWRSFGKAGAT